ncbi:MAG: hypothetical protein UY41_C0014G0008 [Candidatus Moranbacteria bacterium GW2011_GWE1_49_15]|nr:MAG: hypothetical protein UX75_C0004G0011 [Candidatus Moranbacteria bacterium GW2011_GWE2_47_10]KKW06807.1 MAG: hypothetical protein UY41_C0014G0008 [Candidatus Moranbacteria bacterium GW2011_GWE1_49_15]
MANVENFEYGPIHYKKDRLDDSWREDEEAS